MGIFVSMFILLKLSGRLNLNLSSVSPAPMLLIPALFMLSSGFKFKEDSEFKFSSSPAAKLKFSNEKALRTITQIRILVFDDLTMN